MAQIIVYSVAENGIKNSTGDTCPAADAQALLDFLLKDSRNTVKLFVDLDDDVSRLLKLLKLSPQQLKDLAKVKKCIVERQYILNYIPGKWFGIDYGYGEKKVFTGFSDLSQYSDSVIDSLDVASHLANEVYQAYLDLGFSPTSLISPANIYRKAVMDKIDMPKFDDVPIDAMEIAYECCKGSWVEAFALGKFDYVYDYDINSAYPCQASQLLDLRHGHWIESNNYQSEAKYGYCRCEVNIENSFSPIIKQYEDRNYTPMGIFETSLTKAEIDFINKWNLGYATILEGYWWIPDKVNIPKPFEAEINRLYQLKQSTTGVKKEIVKRIMAGRFYGYFIEMRGDDFGEMFMAPYAAEIEANTRLKLTESCLSQNVIPLHVAVDGIVTNIPLSHVYPDEERIGEIRHVRCGKGIICSSGLVCIEGKQGKGDFSLSYEQLIDIANKHPQESRYLLEQPIVLTLAHAQRLGDTRKVGATETIHRTIEIGDSKRFYPVMPENFSELVSRAYISEPWPASTLDILENTEKEEEDDNA